jgi:hypothetical protein
MIDMLMGKQDRLQFANPVGQHLLPEVRSGINHDVPL